MWDKIKSWCSDSVTIVWARAQLVFAVLWTVLTSVDLTPIMSPKLLTIWLIVSGITTEIARRRTL